MAIIIPFLIAIVVGFALFCLIFKRHPFSSWLDIIITFWLGVGACSLMTFYTIVIGHGYNPSSIMGVSIFFCICSLPVCWQQLINNRQGYRLERKDGVFLALAILFGFILHHIAMTNPFGDWDAWSFWNYLPHYFFSGGSHINDLFSIASEARHPWFLPCWTLFGGTWMGEETVVFPFVSAQVFTLMLMAAIYYAIYEQTKQILLSVLGCVWMFSVSLFLFHSMSQYADVVMANLILVNVLVLMRVRQDGIFNLRTALMTGVLFGLMAFLKDDGMLCAGIMLFLLMICVRVDLKAIGIIIISFLAVFMASIIVKVWMMDLPQEPDHLFLPHLVDINRWGLVASYSIDLFIKQIGGGVFLLPLSLILFKFLRQYRREESLAVFFVLLYAGVFVVFLVLRQNLKWYFDGTAYRFVYQLIPVMIVIFFFIVGRLRWKYAAAGLMAGLIVFNCTKTMLIVSSGKRLLTASGHFPGEGFVPLNPFLSKVSTVGYVTNYISSIYEENRPALFNYHQAKFALSPVILDRFKPWDHEYVVLYYFASYDFAPIFVPWPYQVVAKFNNNTILIKSIHK